MQDKYKLLLNLDAELRQKLEQMAKELHMLKNQVVRYLILNYKGN